MPGGARPTIARRTTRQIITGEASVQAAAWLRPDAATSSDRWFATRAGRTRSWLVVFGSGADTGTPHGNRRAPARAGRPRGPPGAAAAVGFWRAEARQRDRVGYRCRVD